MTNTASVDVLERDERVLAKPGRRVDDDVAERGTQPLDQAAERAAEMESPSSGDGAPATTKNPSS